MAAPHSSSSEEDRQTRMLEKRRKGRGLYTRHSTQDSTSRVRSRGGHRKGRVPLHRHLAGVHGGTACCMSRDAAHVRERA